MLGLNLKTKMKTESKTYQVKVGEYAVPYVEFHTKVLAAYAKLSDEEPHENLSFLTGNMAMNVSFDMNGNVCRVEFCGLKD
jgi:hypothetical protein